jgi:putative transposase
VFLDGIVMKRTWAGEVRNISLLVAIGVNAEGFREIVGICEGAKEDKSGWSAFLRHLVDRGLKGVELIISDACRGLVESVTEYLPDARWQRCVVHFYRNVFSHVPATKVRDVSHMLQAIHAQETRVTAEAKASAVVAETLTYYAFPDCHWIKIRTTDVIDKIFVIPARIDQNPCAHARRPMERTRQGWSMRSFHAAQQWATMSS